MIEHISHLCIVFSLFALCFGVLLICIRLLIGPTLADRAAALDLLSVFVIALISIFVFLANHPIYLDIVIAIALVTFLGTLAFAQFIEFQLHKKKSTHNHD